MIWYARDLGPADDAAVARVHRDRVLVNVPGVGKLIAEVNPWLRIGFFTGVPGMVKGGGPALELLMTLAGAVELAIGAVSGKIGLIAKGFERIVLTWWAFSTEESRRGATMWKAAREAECGKQRIGTDQRSKGEIASIDELARAADAETAAAATVGILAILAAL